MSISKTIVKELQNSSQVPQLTLHKRVGESDKPFSHPSLEFCPHFYLSRVCRRFYFLAWEPELWERLSFLGEEDLDIDRALKTTFQLVRCIIINHPLIAVAN